MEIAGDRPSALVDVGLLHHLQNWRAYADSDCDVAPLALGIDCVRRARFARAGKAGDTTVVLGIPDLRFLRLCRGAAANRLSLACREPEVDGRFRQITSSIVMHFPGALAPAAFGAHAGNSGLVAMGELGHRKNATGFPVPHGSHQRFVCLPGFNGSRWQRQIKQGRTCRPFQSDPLISDDHTSQSGPPNGI